MRKWQAGLCPTIAVVLIALFTSTDVGALADGNGVCEFSEAANFECGVFGTNVIEFRGTATTTCALNGGGSAPCTVYFYKYTGAATNQANVAIPLKFTMTVSDKADVHCSQYITDGSGDPTTGFGKNLLSLGICRLAFSLGSLPPTIIPPNTNFFIATDPSTFDHTMPLDWQLRQSKNEVFAASIVGPVMPPVAVLESAVTLTTPEGRSVQYQIDAGQITIVGGQARLIPQNHTKLCLLNRGGSSTNFPTDWTCETISFVTEQCDIKTTGSDPCRWIGGTCIQY